MLPRCESMCLKHRGEVVEVALWQPRPLAYLCEAAIEEAQRKGFAWQRPDEVASLRRQLDRLRGVPEIEPREMLEQLVLWAWKHVEISEGRACELLKLDRMGWRGLVERTNTVQE
jgi:hypothetical protein